MTSPASPFAATTRPEVLVFLDEIKANPDDDTPRLIFADWLQENGTPGEAARGELMRLQVVRHQLLPSDPRQPLLRRREMQLLSLHWVRWLGGLADCGNWFFERGLLQLQGDAENLLGRKAVAAATPENTLYLESLFLREMSMWDTEQLDSSPYLPHLSTLSLIGEEFRPEGLARLVRSPNVSRLRWLGLSGNRLGPEGARALAASPHLAGLAMLDLTGNRILNAGAQHLASSPHLQNLRSLRLKGNRIGEEARAELVERFGNRVSFE
jgi:uncharacterized protein (TIGR02996 family)